MHGSEENQQVVSGIVGGLKLVMTFIGVLTLAIGGVGIMNIMFRQLRSARARIRRPAKRSARSVTRSCCSSSSKGWRRRSPAASSALRSRTAWSGC